MNARQINAQRKANCKPPLNFALFRKVIKKLETAPMAYDQATIAEPDEESPCGTAACIGGWADILSAPKEIFRRNGKLIPFRVDLGRAADSLGLDRDDSDEDNLFTGYPGGGYDGWASRKHREAWRKAATRKGQARVAIRYLTHILKTGRFTD